MGSINIFKPLSTYLYLSNIKIIFVGMPRIEPGAAGREEARMLPLCYAAPYAKLSLPSDFSTKKIVGGVGRNLFCAPDPDPLAPHLLGPGAAVHLRPDHPQVGRGRADLRLPRRQGNLTIITFFKFNSVHLIKKIKVRKEDCLPSALPYERHLLKISYLRWFGWALMDPNPMVRGSDPCQVPAALRFLRKFGSW